MFGKYKQWKLNLLVGKVCYESWQFSEEFEPRGYFGLNK